MRALVLGLAACGASPLPKPPPVVATTPCPRDVDPIVKELWQTKPQIAASCIALRGGQETFWLVYSALAWSYHTGDDTTHVPVCDRGEGIQVVGWALLRSDRTVVWKQLECSSLGFDFPSGSARDLDGDGIDEALIWAERGEGGMVAAFLTVVGTKATFASEMVGSGEHGDGGCAGEVNFVPVGREQQIAVKLTGDCGDDAIDKRLRWDGHALVPVAAPR
jgi:hypothetical protein